MADSSKFLEFAQSVRFGSNGCGGSSLETRMRPLFGGGEIGSSLIFFNPWDLQAWKTWLELSFPETKGKPELMREVVRRFARDFKPFSRHRLPRAVYARQRRGAVILLRNQKVVVIDRLRGQVFHILRKGFESERGLLESEVMANGALPHRTISVLYTHTEQSPYFFVQAYVRQQLRTWRELLPCFGKILEALFDYYEHFGFREIDTGTYVERLAACCRDRLKADDRPEARAAAKQLSELVNQCRTRIARLAPLHTVLTRVHGDFISAHVFLETQAGDQESFALTDWSESHEYSVFHDLFYFHFQNYESDFIERVLAFRPEMLPYYFGSGAELLARQFHDRWAQDLSPEYLRLNWLVCFVQELEHRLLRLHGQVVDFWVEQTGRMLQAKQ